MHSKAQNTLVAVVAAIWGKTSPLIMKDVPDELLEMDPERFKDIISRMMPSVQLHISSFEQDRENKFLSFAFDVKYDPVDNEIINSVFEYIFEHKDQLDKPVVLSNINYALLFNTYLDADDELSPFIDPRNFERNFSRYLSKKLPKPYSVMVNNFVVAPSNRLSINITSL
jgi:hypothetical protein